MNNWVNVLTCIGGAAVVMIGAIVLYGIVTIAMNYICSPKRRRR